MRLQLVKMTRLLFCVVVLLTFLATSEGGKYSKDTNLNWKASDAKTFRMKKVNVLWETVKKRVPDYRLKELHKELQIQDKLEGDLKKAKAEHGDKDGSVEAQTLSNLRRIVDKFGLEAYMAQEMVPPPSNEIPMDPAQDLERDTELRDKRLSKLWQQAIKVGFSDEDLLKLKEEFWHQQMKIDELSLLRDHLKDLEDVDENSVDRFQDGKDPKTVSAKQKDLKDLHMTVQDGYLRLEVRASKTGLELELKDPRVLELWIQARKSNMTEKELISFKEELKHFEHRIQKHEFYQDQVIAAGEDAKEIKLGKKQKELKQMANDNALKVKITHTDLREKVKKFLPHSEL